MLLRGRDTALPSLSLPVPDPLPARSGHREAEHSPDTRARHELRCQSCSVRAAGKWEEAAGRGGEQAQPGGWAGAWLSHIFMARQGFMVRL